MFINSEPWGSTYVLSARKMTLLKANLGVACPSSALALMEDGAKS